MDRRRFLGSAAMALAGPALAFPAAGKPLKLIVGYPAGGGTDLQARLLAQYLGTELGVPALVDNRPGAGTMIGAVETAKAPPDGQTVMYTPASTLTQLPQTLQAVRYDPLRDFTPVAQCALGPTVLVLQSSIPATNLRELIAYAKKNPGKLNYVSQGVGTSADVLGQMLARQGGIDIVHVPYKGANDVAKDFIAGRVHLQFASSSAATQLARSGQVRLLGIVSPRRSELFPSLPTMTELGISGMDMDTSLGLIGPAGMPAEVVDKLSEAARRVMALPHLREEFRASGVEPRWASAADFSAVIRESHAAWGRLLASIGFQKQ
ncbi:Bug family tripartite tricarboxylate transporter substrate binding protein [Xenophilus aerolatus]|nr:tripartite tricarboxylate transporter substrate binding protein [Xenophilus aerolatus]